MRHSRRNNRLGKTIHATKMPSNRQQLHLRSASEEQFRRPRKTSSSYRRKQQQQQEQQRRRTTNESGGVTEYGQGRPSNESSAVSSSAASSSPGTSALSVLGLEIDLENVDPQQSPLASTRAKRPSFGIQSGAAAEGGTKNRKKVSAASTLTSCASASASNAAAPRESADGTPMLPPPPMLSFEEFKKMRRREKRSNGGGSGHGGAEGGRRSYAAAAREGRPSRDSEMSFEEFQKMKRLLAESNNSTESDARRGSWMKSKKGPKQQGQRKQQSKRRSQNKGRKQKQYGADPAAATAVAETLIAPEKARDGAASKKAYRAQPIRGYPVARNKPKRRSSSSKHNNEKKSAAANLDASERSGASEVKASEEERDEIQSPPSGSDGADPGPRILKESARSENVKNGNSKSGGGGGGNRTKRRSGASKNHNNQAATVLTVLSPVPEDRPKGAHTSIAAPARSSPGDDEEPMPVEAQQAANDDGAANHNIASSSSNNSFREYNAFEHDATVANARKALRDGDAMLLRERYVVAHNDIPVAMSTLTEEDACGVVVGGGSANPSPRFGEGDVAAPLSPIRSIDGAGEAKGATVDANERDGALEEARGRASAIWSGRLREEGGESGEIVSIYDEAERLPGGMPSVLVIHEDWEERAGFVTTAAGGGGGAAVDCRRKEDAPIVAPRPDIYGVVPGASNVEDERRDDGDDDDEEEEEIVEGEEGDPRNVSMWAVCPPDEELDDDDDDDDEGTVEYPYEEDDGVDDDPTVVSPASPAFSDDDERITGFETNAADGEKINALAFSSDDDESFIGDIDAHSESSYGKLSAFEKDASTFETPFDARDDNDDDKVDVLRGVSSREEERLDFDDDDHDDDAPKLAGEVRVGAKSQFALREEDRELWPSMNFDGVMFHKDGIGNGGGEASPLGVVGADDDDGEKGATERVGADNNDDEEAAAAAVGKQQPSQPTKRELRGRLLLVRMKKKMSIKKRISKVPRALRKMFFLPFGSSGGNNNNNKGGGSSEDHGADCGIGSVPLEDIAKCIVVTSPNGSIKSIRSIRVPPASSPSSSASVASIASSVLSASNNNGNNGGTGDTPIIGAVPVKSGIPRPAQSDLLYGAIDYNDDDDGRSAADESTVVELPPPPQENFSFPSMMVSSSSEDEEDAVSFLAQAMRQMQQRNDTEDDDGEDSVLLLIAPKEDGTEEICHVIGSVSGEDYDANYAQGEGDDHNDDDVSFRSKATNLASLFDEECCDSLKKDTGSVCRIMDAVEVEGGILLTPMSTDGEDRSNVFRRSVGASASSSCVRDLLLGSVIDSDDDEDDDTLLYHDGCTAIQQASTFGDDDTVDTMTSGANPSSECDEGQMLPRTGQVDEDDDHAHAESFASSLQFDGTLTSPNQSTAHCDEGRDCATHFSRTGDEVGDDDDDDDDASAPKSSAPALQFAATVTALGDSSASDFQSPTASRRSGTGGESPLPSPSDFRSPRSHTKKSSPSPAAKKPAPKSASKSSPKKRLSVRDRVSNIHRRMEYLSAASSCSYDADDGSGSGSGTTSAGSKYGRHLLRQRRGEGRGGRRGTSSAGSTSSSLSWRSDTSSYVRSVPIGIAKTYSRDSLDFAKSFDSSEDRMEGRSMATASSYAQKYTGALGGRGGMGEN